MTPPADDKAPESGPKLHAPIDVVDGIADREAKPPRWKYLLIAAIFLAWVGFLLYCKLAGNL